MCNLYSETKGQEAIRTAARVMRDVTGNLQTFPGIFPDYSAPIVRNAPDGVRELSTARWGMPSSQFALMESAKKRAQKLGQGRAGLLQGVASTGAGHRHDEHPQHVLEALAALARRRKPLRRPIH